MPGVPRSGSPGPQSGEEGLGSRWQRLADNLPRHLLGVSRDFEPRLLRALRARGHPGLRPSFARFLYLVWGEPRPLNSIAEELGISRQAASHTAALVEDAGYVERRPNPADGRSKLVAITPQGRAVDDERAREAIAKCEARYEAMIGTESLWVLRGSLAALRDGLHVSGPPASARASLGVLPLVALKARDDMVRSMASKGHDLTPSHHEVLPLIGEGGARPVDVARFQGISRQAAGSTLQELEARGYLESHSETTDRRGVVFTLTGRGLDLVDQHVAAADEVEARSRAVLGHQRFDRLRRVAKDLFVALQLEAALAGGDARPEEAIDGSSASFRARPEDLEALANRLRRSLSPVDVARLGMLLATRDPRASGHLASPTPS
jgi:DNA-binding MarR family transcriptional regulator